MKNTIDNFKAGSISSHFSEWTKITSDQWLLDIVKNGYAIEFESDPSFSDSFHQSYFSSEEKQILSKEIEKLLHMNVLKPVESQTDQFLSNIFLVPKHDGGHRLIFFFFFFFFLLWFNVPVNKFSVMLRRSHLFLGITSTFGE